MPDDRKTLVQEPEVHPNGYEIVHSKSPVFYEVYERKDELQHQTHYCPGCGHGVAHKLIAEAIEDLGLQDGPFLSARWAARCSRITISMSGMCRPRMVAHPQPRPRSNELVPDKIVISYQGDGDLAAIGTAEIIHAANRGEKITVFFVNNAIYGMTGGQMAPTTLVGQKSTTSPWGRRPGNEGYPLHMSELLSTLEAPVYVERVALADNKNIMKARKAVRRALENQRDGVGFSFVEILSPCPTIWGKDPVEARRWIAEKLIPAFPLNVFRDRKPEAVQSNEPPQRLVSDVLEISAKDGAGLTNLPKHPHHFRDYSIKIAGFGGQGVLLLGQLLTEMGMREGLEVSWLPSYGPEMRSGSAHCHVCLSKERIGSPLVSHPDVLIAMNEISLRKFASQVSPGGLILYNRDSLPADFTLPQARIICIPASEIADKLGSTKVTNIVLMGALLEETECLSPATADGRA